MAPREAIITLQERAPTAIQQLVLRSPLLIILLRRLLHAVLCRLDLVLTPSGSSVTKTYRGYACNTFTPAQLNEATLGCTSRFGISTPASVTVVNMDMAVTSVATQLTLAGAYFAFSIQVRNPGVTLQSVRPWKQILYQLSTC